MLKRMVLILWEEDKERHINLYAVGEPIATEIAGFGRMNEQTKSTGVKRKEKNYERSRSLLGQLLEAWTT
jgi:hypothetical protein